MKSIIVAILGLVLTACSSFGTRPGGAVAVGGTVSVGYTTDGEHITTVKTIILPESSWLVAGFDVLRMKPYINIVKRDGSVTRIYLDEIPPSSTLIIK